MTDYTSPAPVFADADYQADILGYASDAASAMILYHEFYNGTGAMPSSCEKATPERKGEGPVDGWIPVFATDTLSFDGKSINGPDRYRSRLATFANDEAARDYGPLFATSPELVAALETWLGTRPGPDYVKWTAPAEIEDMARAALATARGK